MIKLIIFDLCGVIFRCEEPPFFSYFSKKYKVNVKEVEDIYTKNMKNAELGEISADEAIKRFLVHFKISEKPDNLFKKLISLKGLDIDMIKLIKILRRGYKIAYLTNSSIKLMDISEKRFPIKQYFDFGIISEQIKARKPDLKGFTAILDHFGANPYEAVFIDDSEKNLINAKNMGINTLLFDGIGNLKEMLSNLGILL